MTASLLAKLALIAGLLASTSCFGGRTNLPADCSKITGRILDHHLENASRDELIKLRSTCQQQEKADQQGYDRAIAGTQGSVVDALELSERILAAQYVQIRVSVELADREAASSVTLASK